jgi:4-hydroxybenzoyl-CoA thioesterase
MVRLETDFKRRSRYGDQVEIDIELFKLGGSSLGVQYTVRGEDGERLFAKSIIVLTDLDTGQAVQIGDDMRAALAPYLVEP